MAEPSDDGPAKIFIVLNPVAGQSDDRVLRQAVARHLKCEYEIYETTGQEWLPGVVRAALDQGFDLIVAVGGDGTVSGVAGGVAQTSTPMGIVPVGTGNVLARGLDIPLNPDEALALLAGAHAVKRIDAMQIDKDYFILNVGIGLSALTMRDTGYRHKRRFGLVAYVWTVLKEFLGFQPRCFTVEVDGRRSTVQASEVFIANGDPAWLTTLRSRSDIYLDDGRIDLFVVRARTALDYVRLAWDLLRGREKRASNIQYFDARQDISVQADRRLPVQADGEIIGHTPVQLRVVPDALRVIVPAPAVG